MSLWIAAGATPAALRGVTVIVAQLDGLELGRAEGGTIVLDTDAAGWGWYSGLDGRVPAGRIDLLSVLVHELGHVLGHEHEQHGAMAETLAAGMRELEITASLPWISSRLARAGLRPRDRWIASVLRRSRSALLPTAAKRLAH